VDAILNILRGPYAYLLIVQLLVTAGLALTFIYLIYIRLSQSAANSAVDTSNILEFKKTAAGVAAAGTKSNPTGKTENLDPDALRERVTYLESKLLEYEILQEEIATLSSLRSENETLKKDLQGLKNKPAQAKEKEAEKPAPKDPENKTPPPAAPAQEAQAKPEPKAEAKAEPKAEAKKPKIEPKVEPKLETAAPSPATPKVQEPQAAAPAKDGNPSLEDLLKQIDELSQKSNKEPSAG